MLRADGLTKRFGGFVAVDDLSLSVRSNGLAGLIGPNGAGKSTAFSLFSGFIAADSGHIWFNDRELTKQRPERRARAGLSRSFQVPREFTHLSVRENLAVAVPDQPGESLTGLFLTPGATRRREEAVMQEVDRVLELTQLGAVAEMSAGSLSGGQRKLLELGKLLLARPKLMLLDEPFAGVNPVLIDQLCDVIRRLHATGIGFLIVEHNLGVLARLVDTLLVMDRGRLLISGEPGAVLQDPAVHDAYLGGVV